MSRERRQVSQDAALAKQLAEQYQAEDAAPMFEAVLPTGGPTPKRARGKGKAGSSATPAPPSATAARAALRPFARKLDRTEKQLALTLPDEHLLVNSHSFRTLTWGKDGHREVLRANAPNLVELVGGASVDAVYLPLESDQLSGLRDEWDALPHVVPQVPPDAGYVYVTRESAEKIGVGGGTRLVPSAHLDTALTRP